MSKDTADVQSGTTRNAQAGATRNAQAGAARHTEPLRRQSAIRRAPTSARLAREARQQRWAYLGLFAVIALVVITLVGGAVWQYVLSPAQPVATVNGRGIRTDVFDRYQKLESYLMQSQLGQLSYQISQLQADKKHATSNASLISQLTSQQTQIQTNLGNVPAYTLSQMEQTLERAQAAAKLGVAPTRAQLDASLAKIKKSIGAAGFNRLLNLGVTMDDLRTYLASDAVVQQNVIAYYTKSAPTTQPEAKARHILLGSKDHALALKLANQIRHGANFAALAKQYSIDNGKKLQAGETKQQQRLAESESSANNGGWLRDPSAAFVKNQPTWLTPQTSFVPQVLNAILAMKPGEVRVVQSQYGWHVIQVTQRAQQKLSTAQRQQQAQQKYQTWAQNAVDPTHNKVSPPDPYTQFPQATATQ